MKKKLAEIGALELTCAPTGRTLKVGDTITVQTKVQNTGNVTWTMYTSLVYRNAAGTQLSRFDFTPADVAPGVTHNFNDQFVIPAIFDNTTITVGCNVAKNPERTFLVTSGTCSGLFTVHPSLVSAELVSITVS